MKLSEIRAKVALAIWPEARLLIGLLSSQNLEQAREMGRLQVLNKKLKRAVELVETVKNDPRFNTYIN